MADRRRRILDEAQRLLDEAGVDGFTIRELSSRANVAQRTLYNLFGSKEDIIASAIEVHFNAIVQPALSAGAHEDLAGIVARAGEVTEWVVRLRRYATAMVGVFFTPGADRRIHDSLVRVWQVGGGAWLHGPAASKLLVKMKPGEFEALSALVLNSGYGNIGDWVSGRISETEFRRRARTNVLILCRSYLRRDVRAQADLILREAFGEGAEAEADPTP